MKSGIIMFGVVVVVLGGVMVCLLFVCLELVDCINIF